MSSSPCRREAEELSVERIGDRVSRELSAMEAILGNYSDARAFLTLGRWARSSLRRISRLVDEGLIHPAGGNRFFSRPVRLGIFPLAANPLHWLHVLSGLTAIERFRLDKVVYIVAGRDSRKPALASEQVRHRMAREVLGLFSPLLEYSAVARGNATDGEENVFRMIASTEAKTIHVFYIAGSDHCRRRVPSDGSPDTIAKLEQGIRRRTHGFNPHRHTLSVIFLDRGGFVENVETFLDVRWIHDLPLHTSSTRIRDALAGEQMLSELSYLPYSAYSAICTGGFYSMSLGGCRTGNALRAGMQVP